MKLFYIIVTVILINVGLVVVETFDILKQWLFPDFDFLNDPKFAGN
jgi:hypothetical protein